MVFFPEPVPGPDGEPCFAVLHRPMWDLDVDRARAGRQLPAGLTDDRPGIWISYVPVDDVRARRRAARPTWREHRLVALPEFAFEALKIGAGPPPIRVPEGWLLIHHGVTGELIAGRSTSSSRCNYAAGAMILSADDPSVVLARTSEPLLAPETEDERVGIVPNVVFPTAIEEIDGAHFRLLRHGRLEDRRRRTGPTDR